MSSEVLLEVKDLNVYYRVYEGLMHVLDDVSFSLVEGERLGLVGETGCGKTTTFRALLRVLDSNASSKGDILYKGCNVNKMSQTELLNTRRTEMSMIFQDPTSSLNPVFTVGEQISSVIRANLQAKGINYSENDIKDIALKALSDVLLPDPERIFDSYPFQLSGGMRQRICIAMSVATERKLLLADEPGTSLDVTIQAQILGLLNNLVKTTGMSVILATHSLGVVRETTDRVCIMYGGEIVEIGPTRSLFANPSHPYTRALLACVPKLTGEGIAEGIPGEMVSYLNPPKGCRFQPRCSFCNEDCNRTKPKLTLYEDDHYVACHKADL
ncbi:ABC transporter ATP-binding protein [Acetomicrobium sp. UBA5826]|uniref:ABC transporter ATP-binding protein n=1 Tax=Acetomicrobium sp. UBA5826 TaxID=1946039 RepID=UPI00257953F3|nr:ABC transporter ATP-binding protein [Acetomicrobium sp. UBA5826]